MTFVNKAHRIFPHVEDVLIQSKTHKRELRKDIKILDFIQQLNALIWKGSPDNLFDGLIKWENGSGFIDTKAIPKQSVGFWISDKPLIRKDFKEKVRYEYPPFYSTIEIDGLPVVGQRQWRNISFVGFQTSVDIIPAGTLLRVSLARWWEKDKNTEKRCYLQLSGWYDLD